jgi:hypothetical protein
MARGGKRNGVGRKPGLATTKTREIADRLAQEGDTPLDIMLRVMRNTKVDLRIRLDAAKSAAPYLHPRLAPIGEHRGALNDTANNTAVTAEQVIDDLRKIFGGALAEIAERSNPGI